MSKATVTCTRDVKSQFEKFLSKSIDSFVTKLMDEDDEDTNEEHLRTLFKECFSTKSFKVARGGGKTRRAKSDGPKAPSNAYIQWSNAEGRELSKKNLEKSELKKLKKMSDSELSEKFDGETDHKKILKLVVTSKAIVSNAAKMWQEHKAAEDDTYTKFQTKYNEQRAEYKKLKEAASNSDNVSDEAGPAEASDTESVGSAKGGGKKSKSKKSSGSKGKSKAKSKSKSWGSEDEEEGEGEATVEVKTYSLADFESFDGLAINLGMTVRGGLNTKFGKQTFESLEDAVEALNEDEDAMAIHLDKNGKYTIRGTGKLVDAKANQAPCVTWLKEDDEEDD